MVQVGIRRMPSKTCDSCDKQRTPTHPLFSPEPGSGHSVACPVTSPSYAHTWVLLTRLVQKHVGTGCPALNFGSSATSLLTSCTMYTGPRS